MQSYQNIIATVKSEHLCVRQAERRGTVVVINKPAGGSLFY